MSDNIYRFPLKLDPSDPRDGAIIDVLMPLVRGRRASHAVRDALYQYLVMGSSAVAAPAPVSASLPSFAPVARAVRPVRSAAAPVPMVASSPSNSTSADSAFDALLEAF